MIWALPWFLALCGWLFSYFIGYVLDVAPDNNATSATGIALVVYGVTMFFIAKATL